jgi:hypothetical protein
MPLDRSTENELGLAPGIQHVHVREELALQLVRLASPPVGRAHADAERLL